MNVFPRFLFIQYITGYPTPSSPSSISPVPLSTPWWIESLWAEIISSQYNSIMIQLSFNQNPIPNPIPNLIPNPKMWNISVACWKVIAFFLTGHHWPAIAVCWWTNLRTWFIPGSEFSNSTAAACSSGKDNHLHNPSTILWCIRHVWQVVNQFCCLIYTIYTKAPLEYL